MHTGFRALVLSLLLVLPGTHLGAQTAVPLTRRADTRLPSEQFRWTQLVVPGILFTGGAIGVRSEWYAARINEPVRDYAARLRGDNYLHFDDYIQYIPSAAYLGIGFGRPCDHRFGERALVACTAWATTALLTLPVKHFAAELRPDGSAFNSFPSGHTATAFVGAEMVRREYGGWWGAGAYGFAVMTALLRVYHERHWVNDVLGGAAVGILSAQAAYWLLPDERRLFGLENKDLSLLAVPYTDGRSTGLSLAMRF